MSEKIGIFTKEQHVEKIVNYLNLHTDIEYIISTNRWEPDAFDTKINVSYCFPWLIKNVPNDVVWYNYHPNILPEFGDWGNYVRALKQIRKDGGLLKNPKWGASLALIDEGIDLGPVLKTIWFPLESIPVNTQELADITHYWLFQLFKQTIGKLQNKPMTKEQLERL